MRILIIILFLWTNFVKAQSYQIVLDKANKHYLDSLHVIYSDYLINHNHVDYKPAMLADSAHWILPPQILSDTSFSRVYNAIIGAGLQDSIIVRVVNENEMIQFKRP